MEDEQIVELYLDRDELAVQHTAEKYGRRLRALAFGVVRDAQTAEECENDTYKEGDRHLSGAGGLPHQVRQPEPGGNGSLGVENSGTGGEEEAL